MYTEHYTDLIHILQYTSVYLSVRIMYTGSLYLLIHDISCSDKDLTAWRKLIKTRLLLLLSSPFKDDKEQCVKMRNDS